MSATLTGWMFTVLHTFQFQPACQPYFTPPGLTQQSVPFLGLPQSAPAMPVPPSRTFAAPTTSIFSQGGTHVPYSQSGLVPTTISGPGEYDEWSVVNDELSVPL